MKKLVISAAILGLLGYFLMQCSSHHEEHKRADSMISLMEQAIYIQKEGGLVFSEDTTFNHLKYLKRQFEDRRADFLELHKSDLTDNLHASLVKLFIDEKPLDEGFISAINKINKREDCADFRMIGLIRFIYQFWDTSLVRKSLQDSIQQTILNFKYWPDEPGIDNMCTWSENHHILFSTCEYLAGHYYKDKVFSNSGHSGFEKYERGKARVERWLDLRYKTGFSEWLSNVYYTEDIAPLVALADFSPDEDIRIKAMMVLDLILLDMALNNYKGTFGSTHGRSYFRSKISGKQEGTRSIYKLLFDLNRHSTGNMATSALAISDNYKIPAVLFEVANDTMYHQMVNMQRMGLKMEEIENYGLDFNRLEDGMTFLSFEAYCHPKTINLTMEMFDEYNWWENKFFKPFAKQKGLLGTLRKTHLLPVAARIFNKDLNRNTRTEVNIYTYKTPDYMLSSAQDYKKGYGGDQQAIWSAVLDEEAIVFTTHPVGNTSATPDYWTGSGNLPRVAQHENVAIILYKISTAPGLYVTHDLEFTHAWFPKEKFDNVIHKGNWIFGSRGDAYIGLWSHNPLKWQDEGEYANAEIIADGKKNIWLCEMGNAEKFRSFEHFVELVSRASINAQELDIAYDSPSQGHLEFGWDKPLVKKGNTVVLEDYPRYLNHYTSSSFPAENVSIRAGKHFLNLNYKNLERETSGFLN
jgi:hypothetical protein